MFEQLHFLSFHLFFFFLHWIEKNDCLNCLFFETHTAQLIRIVSYASSIKTFQKSHHPSFTLLRCEQQKITHSIIIISVQGAASRTWLIKNWTNENVCAVKYFQHKTHVNAIEWEKTNRCFVSSFQFLWKVKLVDWSVLARGEGGSERKNVWVNPYNEQQQQQQQKHNADSHRNKIAFGT